MTLDKLIDNLTAIRSEMVKHGHKIDNILAFHDQDNYIWMFRSVSVGSFNIVPDKELTLLKLVDYTKSKSMYEFDEPQDINFVNLHSSDAGVSH